MEKEKFEQHKRQIGGDVTEFLNRVCHPVLIKKRNIKEFKKEVSTCVYLKSILARGKSLRARATLVWEK